MKFDNETVVLVVACLVVTVGGQIQAKLLVSFFSTPLLAGWLFSCFLATINGLQWIFGNGSQTESKSTGSSLYMTILHTIDITVFFIALNYSSIWTIALVQLFVLNAWQISTLTERTTTHTRAGILCCVGVVVFVVGCTTSQLQWSLTELFTATLHAYVNYYLHHYAQRYAESAQYFKAEMYASGTLVALLAPFAWLELRTIYLSDVNTSYTAVTLALACILCYGYRHCGIFFNPLTQPDRAKFLITAALLGVLFTSYTNLTAFMVISLGLVSAAAYLSSVGTFASQQNESKTKFSILAILCTMLLLAQGLAVVMDTADVAPETMLTATNYARGLPPIPLENPQYELNRIVCLRKVRERVIQDVSSYIKNGEPIAFMDFPMHWNLGDIFIWQGTQHILEIHGQFPIVTDSFMDRNISRASSLIQDGVVFLQGGGNFGDLWRDNSNFRVKVAKEMKNNDIVFLPQSIRYIKKDYIEADNNTFQENDRLVFMLREHASIEFSETNFPGVVAKYVPDMAFVMGPQTPSANPIVDIILLLRIDKESKVVGQDKKKALQWLKNNSSFTFEAWDFPVFGFPLKIRPDNKTVVYNYTQIYTKQWLSLGPNNRHAFLGVRTQMANNLFSRGRLVITDRLHASIMSTLLGKPVIYLDNSYKKITNVRGDLAKEFEECSDTNLRARHVDKLMDAVQLAVQILKGEEKI